MNAIFHALRALADIDGARAGAIVDANAALCLATFGSSSDIETEAALHAQTFAMRSGCERTSSGRAEVELMVLFEKANVHLVARTRTEQPLLAFVALDREDSNLVFAMRAVRAVVDALEKASAPVAQPATLDAIAS